MRVTIFVSLKQGVLDPQGKAIERSLHSLGYDDVGGVRAGKVYRARHRGRFAPSRRTSDSGNL